LLKANEKGKGSRCCGPILKYLFLPLGGKSRNSGENGDYPEGALSQWRETLRNHVREKRKVM